MLCSQTKAATSDLEWIPVSPHTAEKAQTRTPVATELDTIEVTGSRLRRADVETAQPLLILDRAAIERTGANSVADLLQRLTVAGSAAGASVSNSEVGTAEIDLRNLGSQRVLVLVNGRRWVGGMYFRSTSSVDLNTIPLSLVERIEVLKDGASATYGSDAVAGVINIITRAGAAGWEARANAGGYLEGGAQQDLGLTWGQVAARHSIVLDMGHRRQDGITNGERDLTKFYRFGAGPTRGFPQTPRGTLLFVPTADNARVLGPSLCPGDPDAGLAFCQIILKPGQTITGDAGEDTATVADRYEPFDDRSADFAVNDLYDPNALLHLRYPDEQTTLFGSYSLFAGDVRLWSELLYAHRRIRQNSLLLTQFGDLAPERFDQVFVAADNPFNPFDQDIGRADGSGVGSGIVLKAISEAIPNVVNAANDTFRLAAGLDGDVASLASGWRWSLGALYARSRNEPALRGLNLENLGLALGPRAECDATPGCVPLNIFGAPGAINEPMLAFITYPSRYPKRQDISSAFANIAGELPGVLAQPIRLAAGVEYRRESYGDRPDALIEKCISASCFSSTDGSIEVFESYLEAETPLLRDQRFARLLEIGAAVRHSRYARGLDASTYRLGLRWQPVEEVLLRVAHSTAFRAPSISDLYLSSAQLDTAGLSDPCSDYAGQQGGEPQSESVQQQCREAGVPPGYVQGPTLPVRDGGNPDLAPERARSVSAGLVYSPDAWPGSAFELDAYRIALEDPITLLDPQRILDGCYLASGARQTCALLTRDPESGAVTDLRFQPINIGGRRIQGLDLNWDFHWPSSARVRTLLTASYLQKDESILVGPGAELQRVQQQGTSSATNAFPRWRVNAELVWLREGWSAAWRTRYLHGTTERCDDGLDPSYALLGLCSDARAEPGRSRNRLGSVTYHDLQVRHESADAGTSYTIGVRNLFDRDPPASYSNFYNAFDASSYDIPGVQLYARVTHAF